ncbi:MAG: M20/M25/M40 family metallo-hydrolase [Vicinamibacterales bacterium]
MESFGQVAGLRRSETWDGVREDAVRRFVDAHLPDWIELLQALIRERSVFEHEHGITKLVEDRLAAIGVQPVRVPHDAARLACLPGAQAPFSAVPGRHSLVARLDGAAAGRSLVFNTHLDIVSEGDPRAWTYEPFGARIVGDLIFGRGATDDKAGVAIALAVLQTLVQVPLTLAGDVVFHFVLEDESVSNGSLLCLAAGYGADTAVIIDGTRPERAIDRHAGQLHVAIDVRGKPASISVAHLGVNAADRLARLVARLADRVRALNPQRQDPWTQFPSPFQFVTQRMFAEAPQLTVPEHAEATCCTTFPPPWTVVDMRTFLEEETLMFAREHRLDPVPTLTYGFSAEPVVSDASELAAALALCTTREGFASLNVGPSTGTSDMRHFAAAGIPCLLYGPGTGFNPHRPDEHYRLDDFPRMVRLFVNLAAIWCRPSRQPTASPREDARERRRSTP